MARGLSCSEACGIFLDQGSNPCLLLWQTDSLPLSHQGSPEGVHLIINTDGALLLFLKFYFIFKLYNIVLVLPNIEMNLPQVYMCSPS